MRGRYNDDKTTSQKIEIRADEISNAFTTIQKNSLVNIGDYIITGIKGEQYPCKPDIFNRT